MAAAELLGYSSANGDWDGYGVSGHLVYGNTPGFTLYSSLPAWISSINFTNVRVPPTQATASPDADAKWMALPPSPGGRTAAVWLSIGSSHDWTADVAATSETASYILSMRHINNTASRTNRARFYTADGVTLLLDTTSTDTFPGLWCRVKVTGSVKINITTGVGGFPMVNGWLFDPASIAPLVQQRRRRAGAW